MQPRVVIAVPTHNYRDYLAQLLISLCQTRGEFSVLVRDNGTTDGTEAMLAEIEPVLNYPISWSFTPELTGVTASREWLMREAEQTGADYMCFLDGDIECTHPDWLERLLQHHENGVSTGKLVLPDGMIWSAGGCWGTTRREATCRGFHGPDRPEFSEPCQVPHVPTALAFMRMDLVRRLHMDVQGLAPSALEDTDLCMQVQFDHGESCWYWPDVVAMHHSYSWRERTGRSIDEDPERHRREFAQSERAFWNKWGARIRERWGV